MRFLLSLILILLSIACAILAGAAAMLDRNVLDPAGFTETVVGTVQSPAGLALVRTQVERTVQQRAAGQPAALSDGLATAVGGWAVQALSSDAAVRVLAPTAVGLQQGLLNGKQTGSAQIDVRALAAAANPPPLVTAFLAAVDGDLIVQIRWVPVSPPLQRVLQELDRHRGLSMLLVVLAVVFGLLAIVVTRGRAVTLILLGLGLAITAFVVSPVATTSASWLVDASATAIAATLVDQLLRGWTAISRALMAIGLALALVGVVVGLRRA